MRKSTSLFFIVLILLTGCSTQTPKDEHIVVGVTAPFSGDLAVYGDAFKNGIQLAQEDLGSNSKIEFILEDTQYDPKKAISAYQKLRQNNNIDVLIDWGSSTGSALAPVVQNDNIVMLSVSNAVDTAQSENIIQALPPMEVWSEALWQELRARNIKNVGVIKLEITYFESFIAALEKTKNPDETIIIIDTIQWDTKDLKPSILKLQKINIDAVAVFGLENHVMEYYEQAAQLGYKKPVIGSDVFESEALIASLRGKGENAIYPNMDVSQEFKERYKKRFGNDMQISYAGTGYDLAMIVGTQLENKETPLASMKALSRYQGVGGVYDYKETSEAKFLNKPIRVKEIRENKIVTIR